MLSAGQRIGGRYLIRRLIARGGNSEVYEAEHAAIGRRVAIKLVQLAVGTADGLLERLRREARICGTLHHPNVCEVYDVGHLDDGTPFLVMERLRGPTLEATLAEGPLPIPVAVEVGRKLLDALAAAHRSGVLHRDVKPGNVILHRAEHGEVTVKLVDFGIARPMQLTPLDRSVTIEGMLVGTPHYMSPEQLRAEDIDGRADLYAVAVVLYEAITGTPPFNQNTLSELAAAVLRDPVAPIRGLRPDCPRDLADLVLRAMGRSRDDRPGDATAFERELAHLAEAHGWPEGQEVWRLANRVSSFLPPAPNGQTLPPCSGIHPVEAHPTLDGASTGEDMALGQEELRTPLDSLPEDAAAVDSLAPVDVVHETPRSSTRGIWLGAAVLLGAMALLPAWLDEDAGVEATATPRFAGSSGSVGGEPRTAEIRLDLEAQLPSPGPAFASQTDTAAAEATGEVAGREWRRGLVQRDARRRGERRSRPSLVETGPAESPPGAQPTALQPSADSTAARSEATDRVDTSAQRADELSRSALAAYVRGQMPRALALYRRAVREDPQSADAHRGLGMAAKRMGQNRAAIRAFRRYLELSPQAPDAARIRGLLARLDRAAAQ